MKTRRRVTALLAALSVILSMLTVGKVPVLADSFNKGDELEDVVFQIYAQDSTNYSWHVYDEIDVKYDEPMNISWEQDPTEKFGEIGGSLSFGFQFADNNLHIGQTGTAHFTVKDIKLTFAGMPEFSGISDIDKNVKFTCKEASWGKTGNSTEISLREDVRRAYPDLPVAGLVKSLVKVTCTFQLHSLERGEWVGPQNPDGSEFRNLDAILPELGAGVSITNALDKADCTGDEITTQMIDSYKKLGYDSLYIPVNYDSHMDEAGTIDDAFLDKVKGVVDYAISNDMYVILSVTGSGNWLSPLPELQNSTNARLTAMYSAIATKMDPCSDHLLIEALHRPVATIEPTVDPEAAEPPAPVGMTEYNNVLADWHNKIRNVIRGTGTNNPSRTVLFSPYNGDYTLIASMSFGEASNQAISVTFDTFTKKEWGQEVEVGILKDVIKEAETEAMTQKSVPLIITSFGAMNKDNYTARVQYAYDFTTGARNAGAVAFWNDNGNQNETGLISFSDASYLFPIISIAQDAAAKGEKKPAMDIQIETEPAETEAKETEKATTKAAETEAATQEVKTETEKSSNTGLIIVLVIVGIVLIGAVVFLVILFKKKTGSFF